MYRAFEEREIRWYRSAVTMTAGRPGGGKSILGLDHAIKCKVPSLYISCDMSRFQLATRAASILTGESTAGVKELLKTIHGKDHYRASLSKADHLYLAYEKRPDAEALEDVLNAFNERWGIPPHLVVIDNLMNLLPQGSADEWAGLREMSHLLDWFAGELGAAVHVLHHINIGGQRPDLPAPMGGVKGKVVELPSTIISVAKTDTELRFTAVKNREGKEDPMANSYGYLDLSPSTLGLSDPRPRPLIQSFWPRGQQDWHEEAA